MVIANLSARKGSKTRKLSEAQGCELFFLPPYLPNLNPVEEAFGKVKTLLHLTGAARVRP